MTRFFPRDAVQWGEEALHPLRAFAIRSVWPASVTGVVLRLWRAVLLASGSWVFFVVGLTAGILFLCGMLTWHLGNFPVRRWPLRVLAFWVFELAAEMLTSTVLIVLGRERFGSVVATWDHWFAMAAQTSWQRALVMALFALILATVVQVVRRLVDQHAAVSQHSSP